MKKALLALLICLGLSCAFAQASTVRERSVYIEAGRTALKIGNATEAVRRFDAAAAIAPLSAEEELERTKALIASGRAVVAVATLRRLVATYPNQPQFAEALTGALLASGEVEEASARLGDPAPAPDAPAPPPIHNLSINELEERLEANPGDLWTTRTLGESLHRSGQPAEAAPYLMAALVQLPDDLRLRQDLGISLLRSGHAEQAAAELRRVVAREPNNQLARDRLADALARSGQHAMAIKEMEQLGASPGSSLAERRAFSKARMARDVGGLAELEELFASDPNDRQSGITLAQAYLRLRAPDSAVTVLAELQAAGHRDAEVLSFDLRARGAIGRDITAPLQELHALRPNDRGVARQLALAHSEAGRHRQAAQLWQQLSADDPEALRALVLSAWAAGDTATTVASGPAAIGRFPKDAALAYVVRSALLQQRDYGGALALTPWHGEGSVAEALAEAGRLPAPDAAAELERLWLAQPVPPVGRAYARALIGAGQAEEGLKLMERVQPPLEEPEDLLWQARAWLDLGRGDQARPLLAQLEVDRPSGWWEAQARLQLLDGDSDAARKTLEQRWQEIPDNLHLARRLAELLAWRSLHAGEHHFDPAEATWAALNLRHGGDPLVAASDARHLVAAGATAAAFKRAREIDGLPSNERHALQADLRAASDQPQGAAAAADSCARLGGPVLPRVRAWLCAEQPERARQLLDQHLGQEPGDGLARLERLGIGHLPTPLVPPRAHPFTAEEADPRDLLWTAAHGHSSAPDSLAATLSALLDEDPHDRLSRLALARLLVRHDQAEAAVPHYRQLLAQAPGRIDWALEEARALTLTGKREEAEAAWQSLRSGAEGRPDIQREARAGEKRLAGDLKGAHRDYCRLVRDWPSHEPAARAAAELAQELAARTEARRTKLGTLAPTPGRGMPLVYSHPSDQLDAGSHYTLVQYRGREKRVGLALGRLEVGAGQIKGFEIELVRNAYSDPIRPDSTGYALNGLATEYRWPADPANDHLGLIADFEYTMGSGPVASFWAGGLGLVMRRDSQSVVVVGFEQRPMHQNLPALRSGLREQRAFTTLGASIMDDRLRLGLLASASRLSDDNQFWTGGAHMAVALGPAYQSLVLGAELELTGFHQETLTYFSPRRQGQVLATIAWGRRAAADEPVRSPWKWSLAGAFGVEQLLTGNAPPQPLGRFHLRLGREIGPLNCQARILRLITNDYHEHTVSFGADYRF